MKHLIICFLFFINSDMLICGTLHVGNGHTYSSLSDAGQDVRPGDTILFHEGVYPGGEFLADLQGEVTKKIYILGEQNKEVIIRGGTNSWQLSDAAYLHIEGFIFEQQTGNGFNMDDGGSGSLSHHITIQYCIFRDMNADGNNDLLKLSGVDDFKILNCTFLNGSAGGSGIDMVGCHNGEITRNIFENMGSNAIQAKGGTQWVAIEKNFFKNCGQRSINIGGSTGLEFFRPINAPFEASDVKVLCNIFVGSVAPIAFVGAVKCDVINNTIIDPGKWVMRILQESVDPDRFEPCGNNLFRNNIVYKNNAVSTDCNIGPDTAPETFNMSHNLWYNHENPANSAASGLPVPDSVSIVGEDPLFEEVPIDDYSIPLNSPATGAGYKYYTPFLDFLGHGFANPRSIGAIEGDPSIVTTGTKTVNKIKLDIFPNPTGDEISILWSERNIPQLKLEVLDAQGRPVSTKNISNGSFWKKDQEKPGVYFFRFMNGVQIVGIQKVVLL